MKITFCSFYAVLVATLGLAAPQPRDNPVATFYAGDAGYPAWTDQIQWGNVIDMSTFDKGKTAFERFEKARDQLAARGGGVLYYPAGVHDFSEGPFDGPKGRGLMLRSGVVIRGEAPAGRPLATSEKLSPPTKFVFGFKHRSNAIDLGDSGSVKPETPRDWNVIGLMPGRGKRVSDVENVGVAWVHLVGGVIYFGPDIEWGETWAAAGSWKSPYVKKRWANRKPDGTHPWDPFTGGGKSVAGIGKGRLVFGCKLEHAAVLNESVKMGRPDYPDGFGEDGYYMHKFGARIGVYGKHVFVANNRLPISRGRNFKYRQTTRRTFPAGKGSSMGFDPPRESTVFFDYNKTVAVQINKTMLGLTKNSPTGRAGAGFFAESVAVIDNYVFNNGHKGFDVSGTWVTIARNHNERCMLREGKDPEGIGDWELTLDGHLESSPGGNGAISDNLSRAFDLAGRNVWVHRNSFNNLGSDPGNDGEGILCQAHGGSQILSWAITYNQHDKGSGETGYIGAWDVNTAGALFGWNKLPGWVGSINVGKRTSTDASFVGNRAGKGLKPMKGAQVGDVAGNLAPPKGVRAETSEGVAVRVAWTDASDNEAGFRVDRKVAGGKWTPIAYRPPRIQGDANNPQVWMDYLAPPGKSLVYRVVAIDSKDSDRGASEPSSPVVLTVPKTWHHSVEIPRPPRKGKPRGPAVGNLWIPPGTAKLAGLIVAEKTLLEKRLVTDPAIRKAAADRSLGILYFEPGPNPFFPYGGKGDCDVRFLKGLEELAGSSGHPELAHVPWLTIGHSTGGIFCRNLAYWRPDRVLGVIHIKSGNMHHGIHYPERDSLKGVPFLAINGEFEEFGPEGGIRKEYGRQTQWVMIRKQMLARRRQAADHLMSLVVHAGGNHTDWSDALTDLCVLFIHKACEYRLPTGSRGDSKPIACRQIKVVSGWLTDSDLKDPKHKPATCDEYAGDKGLAFWHFDEEMARTVRNYHKGKFTEPDPAIEEDKHPAPGDDRTVKPKGD